ncbi:MAG: phosphoribosylaminoimidazolesuccinocarboxamide synthase [Bdellovibrionales bacterium]
MLFTSKTRRRLYEGKSKVLYEGPEPGTLIQYFKDDLTAMNGKKKDTVAGKGVLCNRISEFLMLKLGEIGVPTHFIKRLNMREQLVRQLDIIPIEVVVRNIAAGSLNRRFGISEGTQLPRSIIEFYLKSDELGDPMVTDEHITAFGWADPHDIEDMVMIALRVNDYLSGLFLGAGLKLVDFKLEFGRMFDENQGVQIVVADEISPDTCRLWDAKTGNKLDKDRFRQDMGGVAEAYQDVAKRLGVFIDPAQMQAETGEEAVGSAPANQA